MPRLYLPPRAAVAQLARASACHAEGRGFESHQPLASTHSPRGHEAPGRFYVRGPSLGLLRLGALAEWLRSGLQSRLHRFDSGRRLYWVCEVECWGVERAFE